jgi:hypothetical protein
MISGFLILEWGMLTMSGRDIKGNLKFMILQGIREKNIVIKIFTS